MLCVCSVFPSTSLSLIDLPSFFWYICSTLYQCASNRSCLIMEDLRWKSNPRWAHLTPDGSRQHSARSPQFTTTRFFVPEDGIRRYSPQLHITPSFRFHLFSKFVLCTNPPCENNSSGYDCTDPCASLIRGLSCSITPYSSSSQATYRRWR
jgi:hypothetical protein